MFFPHAQFHEIKYDFLRGLYIYLKHDYIYKAQSMKLFNTNKNKVKNKSNKDFEFV